MKDNKIVSVTLETIAWNKLQMVSESVGIPLNKEAEILLTFKLSEELPPKERDEFIAEIKAFSPKFSLIIAGIFKVILKLNKKKAVLDELPSLTANQSNSHTIDISIPSHQFQKLYDIGIINGSSVDIEASRKITEHLLEKF